MVENPRYPDTAATFTGRACPICGKPASKDHRPFCSKRCADLDLGQWLTECYRVPADEEADLDQISQDPEN